MVEISYRCEKKSLMALFRCWSRKSTTGNIIRLKVLLAFLVSLYLFLKMGEYFFPVYKGMMANVVLLISIIFDLFLLYAFILIFAYEYRNAKKYWETSLVIKEMGTFIKTILFYEEYAEIKGDIFRKNVTYKIYYEDIQKIEIYKNGIVFFDGKIPCFIPKNLFDTMEDYDMVREWIEKFMNKKR